MVSEARLPWEARFTPSLGRRRFRRPQRAELRESGTPHPALDHLSPPQPPPKSSSPSWTCWCWMESWLGSTPAAPSPQRGREGRGEAPRLSALAIPMLRRGGSRGHFPPPPPPPPPPREAAAPQRGGCSPRRAPCRAGTCPPGTAGPWSRRRPARRISTKEEAALTSWTQPCPSVKPTPIPKPVLGPEPPESGARSRPSPGQALPLAGLRACLCGEVPLRCARRAPGLGWEGTPSELLHRLWMWVILLPTRSPHPCRPQALVKASFLILAFSVC